MTRLTDLQSILLAHAAAHEDRSLSSPPENVAADPARVMTAIAQLLRRGLLEEKEVSVAAALHREDGDLRYGAFITPAGLTAIGVEPATPLEPASAAASPPAPRQTKAALVLALLGREQGATLPELVDATGWLPHTTRAALTGLRKKGQEIERFSRDGTTCYRVTAQ